MRGSRAIFAAFRAQNLMAVEKFDEARRVFEKMYRSYGFEIGPARLKIYPHINLLYAMCLQHGGDRRDALVAYALVLEQIQDCMRWPGRWCNSDEIAYVRCYIRNLLLCLSSGPDDAAFDLAISTGSDCCRYDPKRLGTSMTRMFPTPEPEMIQHNEKIIAKWERRRRPTVAN
jgi:hypothetical protein